MGDVAVLFARADSVYKNLPGCDVFDIDRDARNFGGGCPVVAHPPCRAWGRLRQFSKPRDGELELGPWAVDRVRTDGGVLEHPAESTLFAHCGMPRPGEPADQYGGFTIALHQFHFGHRAEKATWLYIVGIDQADLPAIPVRDGEPTHCVRPAKAYPRKPSITKAEREHTPALFASWLVDLARRCARKVVASVAALSDFSPVEAVGSGAIGPGSNTGQKSADKGHGALVDFLTVVFSADRLAERGLGRVSLLLPGIFQLQPMDVRAGELHAKRWQFYRASAVIVDSNGELVGRIGAEGNGDTICISLSGAACKYVKNWHFVRKQIEALNGRISRCDVAYDDYDGVLGSVRDHELKARATLTEAGGCMLFGSGGTPPKTKFLDDHGGGSGCTLYVGSKGHKQLCIYEKGLQLGVTDSPWVRYEARLYGKHCEVPTEILTSPMKFLRGSYDYLASLFADIGDGIACAVEYTKRAVEHTGAALVKWAKRQLGPSLHLLGEAFGDQLLDFLRENVMRERMPTRFRRVCKASDLPAYVRATMNPRGENLCLS